MAYVETFKDLNILQDDNMVDNDRFKIFYKDLLEKLKKEKWKDLIQKSIDKCAASNKTIEMYYKYFQVTKEECNLDSFLMARCVLYAAEMVKIYNSRL